MGHPGINSFCSEMSRQYLQGASVYVLIDSGCGSSCELTLEALEGLPAVHTVGENTGGGVQFGNLGHLYLPESR